MTSIFYLLLLFAVRQEPNCPFSYAIHGSPAIWMSKKEGRKGLHLTSQLFIQSPPRGHWQGLDELRELDASILRSDNRKTGRERVRGEDERERAKGGGGQDEHFTSHLLWLYFHEFLAVLSWCPCCILLKTGPDVCSKSAAIFCPAPGSLLRQKYVTSGH